MLKRVQEIHDQIRQLSLELEQIKVNCRHPEYFIGFYSGRPGQILVSRLCSDCHKFLETASPREQEDFLQEVKRKTNVPR